MYKIASHVFIKDIFHRNTSKSNWSHWRRRMIAKYDRSLNITDESLERLAIPYWSRIALPRRSCGGDQDQRPCSFFSVLAPKEHRIFKPSFHAHDEPLPRKLSPMTYPLADWSGAVSPSRC